MPSGKLQNQTKYVSHVKDLLIIVNDGIVEVSGMK